MHSFKWKAVRAAGFVVVCCLLTGLLNFALQQYNIARVNVHRIGTTPVSYTHLTLPTNSRV